MKAERRRTPDHPAHLTKEASAQVALVAVAAVVTLVVMMLMGTLTPPESAPIPPVGTSANYSESGN